MRNPEREVREVLVGCADCGEITLVQKKWFIERVPPPIKCTRCGGDMNPATKEWEGDILKVSGDN